MARYGPYELLRRLGVGATAEVHLATRLDSRGGGEPGGALIALKLLLPHLCDDARVREALLREVEHTRRVRHPGIVEVLETGEHEARPFIAMEFVRGWPLAELVKRLRAEGKALTVAEACLLVREAALALHHAHEATGRDGKPLGLIHRDVSPQNLLVREDGHVKVVDFGLAKATLASATHTGAMKGKLAYMPPEQIQGGALDRRVDVFACGAVLWELLCGQRLYPGKSEAELLQQAVTRPLPRADRLVPGLPVELVDTLEQALARDLSARLPTCAALADRLEPFTRPDTARRLASRLKGLFEPLPRDADEARGRRAAPVPGMETTLPAGPLPPVTGRPAPRRATRPVPEETVLAADPGPPALTHDTVIAPEPAPPPRRSAPPRARPAANETRPRAATARERPPLEDDAAASRVDAGVRHPPRAWELDEVTDHRVGAAPQEDLPPAPGELRPRRGAWWAAVLAGILVGGGAAFAWRLLRTPRPPAPAVASRVDPLPEPAPPPRAATAPVLPEGTLTLQSSPPAFVSEDGHDLGMTPLTLERPEGTHRFTLRTADGVRSREVEVRVRGGDTLTHFVEL